MSYNANDIKDYICYVEHKCSNAECNKAFLVKMVRMPNMDTPAYLTEIGDNNILRCPICGALKPLVTETACAPSLAAGRAKAKT